MKDMIDIIIYVISLYYILMLSFYGTKKYYNYEEIFINSDEEYIDFEFDDITWEYL